MRIYEGPEEVEAVENAMMNSTDTLPNEKPELHLSQDELYMFALVNSIFFIGNGLGAVIGARLRSILRLRNLCLIFCLKFSKILTKFWSYI